MSRFRFGPVILDGTIVAPTRPVTPSDPTPPPDLIDVGISILDVKTDAYPAAVVFAPDSYDPATHRPLLSVHFVAVPTGADRPTDPADATTNPAYVVHSADVAEDINGAPLELALPNLADGVRYAILSVLED